MAAKETIAIVGATSKAGEVLAQKLAATTGRMLLISEDLERLNTLADAIKATVPHADIEVHNCLKDACWEADIIVMAVPANAEAEVALRIKEVATQKTVVRLLDAENATNFSDEPLQSLEQLLPYSHIVTVVINTSSLRNIAVTGKNSEAVELITRIAKATGFNVSAITKP